MSSQGAHTNIIIRNNEKKYKKNQNPADATKKECLTDDICQCQEFTKEVSVGPKVVIF